MALGTISKVLIEQAVWNKGHKILDENPAIWRIDDFGTRIHRNERGNRNSIYGWEIDHITAKALGGSDSLTNLRPLNRKNNSTLGGLLGAALKNI